MVHEAARKAFWDEFLASSPREQPTPTTYQAWSFGRSKEAANDLGKLVRKGIKTATASLVFGYEVAQESLPQAGEYNMILDGDGNPMCIIQTTFVEILPFEEVGSEHARLEGEGDLSLNFWREVHWQFFAEECAGLGYKPDPRMPVCCERFRLCYPRL
jgi:uncharacterized protein YhfF